VLSGKINYVYSKLITSHLSTVERKNCQEKIFNVNAKRLVEANFKHLFVTC
jgi:hypothetical protein